MTRPNIPDAMGIHKRAERLHAAMFHIQSRVLGIELDQHVYGYPDDTPFPDGVIGQVNNAEGGSTFGKPAATYGAERQRLQGLIDDLAERYPHLMATVETLTARMEAGQQRLEAEMAANA